MLVWYGAGVSAEPISYDPQADQWKVHTSGPLLFPGVWTGSKLAVASPTSGLSGAIFDPATDTWTPFAGTLPIPARYRFSFTAWLPSTNEILVWGGYKNPSGFSDGAAYDLDTGTWRVIAEGPLGICDEFAPPAVAWVGDRLLISGGGSKWGDRHSAAALYDPVSDSWEEIEPPSGPGYTNVLTARPGGAGERVALWNGDRLEGSAMNYPTNGGALWDSATSSWSLLPAIPGEGPHDGHRFGAIWSTAGGFGVWGGERYGNGFSSDDRGAWFDAAAQSWTALPAGPLSARQDLPAVWTGEEVILWGGRERNGSSFGDGAIFRP